MDQETVSDLTINYLYQEFEKLGSKNTCTAKQFGETAPYWLASPDDANYRAGKAATQKVYHTEPDLTREGGRLVYIIFLAVVSWISVQKSFG